MHSILPVNKSEMLWRVQRCDTLTVWWQSREPAVWPWHLITQCPWFSRVPALGLSLLDWTLLQCHWTCSSFPRSAIEVSNASHALVDASRHRSRPSPHRERPSGSPRASGAPWWGRRLLEKDPRLRNPLPPSVWQGAEGYLSSLGGRALTLPFSCPVALSLPSISPAADESWAQPWVLAATPVSCCRPSSCRQRKKDAC